MGVWWYRDGALLVYVSAWDHPPRDSRAELQRFGLRGD